MPIQDGLVSLAQSFSLKLVAGLTPLDFVIELLSPAAPRIGLTVVDEVVSTVLTPGALDLVFKTKDVRWLNTDITNSVINGGMPINDLLAGLVGSVTTGPTAPPGVPGLIGALAGTIPIPVTNTALQQYPVTLQVRWRILDDQGHVVNDAHWTLGGGMGTGGEIVPPPTHELDPISLVFHSIPTELTAASLPTVNRTIEASVNLTAAAISSGWITLPPIKLTLPALPVPTIAMLFTDTNFTGTCVIMVPNSSPLDQPTLTAALDTLNNVLSPLMGAAGAAAFFVAQLGAVKTALNSAGRIVFRKADEITDLADVETEAASFWDWNGENANDEFSSVLFLGTAGRRLECFNDDAFAIGEGKMNVIAGDELLTMVKTLHMDHKTDIPASTPAGRVTVVQQPDGWNGSKAHWISQFGDELTSLRFGWE